MEKEYNRAIVFSGGGFRFGAYLGMFAAFEEENLKPDLIIGTCGGTMASTIINNFTTTDERKNYLKSKELFNFYKGLKLTKEKMLYRIGLDCKKREKINHENFYIQDFFNKYIIDFPLDMEKELPSLNKNFSDGIPSIFIGAKVLFDKKNVGKKITNEKLYKRVLFTDDKNKKILDTLEPNPSLSDIITNDVEVLSVSNMLQFSRLSVSDMYYMSPFIYNDNYYLGGAIDLIPLELAKQLAQETICELKDEYSNTAEASVFSVFKFSGNERLKHINDSYSDYWVDTSDLTHQLKGKYLKLKINLLKLQLEINIANTYEEYKDWIDQQWEIGYIRGKESATQQQKNAKYHMRNASELNTSHSFRDNIKIKEL